LELLDYFTHDTLGITTGVGLGGVEKVDAGIVGGLHALFGELYGVSCQHMEGGISG
jgi:hypothetical protein